MPHKDFGHLAPVENPGNPTCLAVSDKGDQKEPSSKKDLKIIQLSAKVLPFSTNSTGTQERKSGAIWEMCFAQFCLLEAVRQDLSQLGEGYLEREPCSSLPTALLVPALLNNPIEMSSVATGWDWCVSTLGT